MIYKILVLLLGINLYASGVFDSYFTNPYADEKKDNGFLSLFKSDNEKEKNQQKNDQNLDINFSDDNLSKGDVFSNEKITKVAVLINKKYLYRYLPEISDSINAYLLYKNIPYKLKMFDIDLTPEKLIETIENIKNEYKYIFIYMIKKDNLFVLNNYKNNLFYIPTINRYETNTTQKNIIFGGIDYKEQLKTLIDYVNPIVDNNISIADDLLTTDNETNESSYNVVFEENILLSKKLTKITEELINIDKVYTIKRYMRWIFKNNNYLENSNIFLNTSSEKSASILSYLTYFGYNVKNILSTQINYNPLILTLTQPADRKKLIIASSIHNQNDSIVEYNKILYSDIQYNWLNFATSILLNHVYNDTTNSNKDYANDFFISILNNQINYSTYLYRLKDSRFEKINYELY